MSEVLTNVTTQTEVTYLTEVELSGGSTTTTNETALTDRDVSVTTEIEDTVDAVVTTQTEKTITKEVDGILVGTTTTDTVD